MHFSNLLQNFHLTPGMYPAIGAIIIFAALIVLIIHLQIKVNRLLVGKNAKNLEDSIMNITGSIEELQEFTEEMEKYLLTVEKRLKQSIQSVETIRFNPFKGEGIGGNNSFSTALINERGDGLVLTGLYTRDKVSLFAKPIKNLKSEFELAEEEIAALGEAKKNLTGGLN